MNTEIKEELILNLRQIEGFPLPERKDVFLLEFQKACEQAGYSVAEIANLTRINPQIVEWIYNGEFSKLPSEVFVRGFLKSIARLLELPPDVLANAYSRTMRDDVKTAPSKPASGLGVHVSPATSSRALDTGVKSQSPQASPEGQRPKSAKVNWNFDAGEAKRPSHFGTPQAAGKNFGPSDSISAQTDHLVDSLSPNFSRDLRSNGSSDSAVNDDLSTHALPYATDTSSESTQSGKLSDQSVQAEDFSGAKHISATWVQDPAAAEAAAGRGKKSRKTKERRRTGIKAKSAQPAISETVLQTYPDKVSGQNVRQKPLLTRSETSRKPSKSVSFKVWSVVAGAAIIVASIMWPRERAPNGTVIEEADVIDLNPGKTAAEQESSAVTGSGSGSGSESGMSQEVRPAGDHSSDTQGAASLGVAADMPGNASDTSSANSGAAVFTPSAVSAVSAIPLPQGSWAVPAGMVLEITPKETVKLKAYIDGKPAVTDSLSPVLHKFEFTEKADLYLYDASAVDIVFNGKNIGKVGNKGQFKRLSFVKTVK